VQWQQQAWRALGSTSPAFEQRSSSHSCGSSGRRGKRSAAPPHPVSSSSSSCAGGGGQQQAWRVLTSTSPASEAAAAAAPAAGGGGSSSSRLGTLAGTSPAFETAGPLCCCQVFPPSSGVVWVSLEVEQYKRCLGRGPGVETVMLQVQHLLLAALPGIAAASWEGLGRPDWHHWPSACLLYVGRHHATLLARHLLLWSASQLAISSSASALDVFYL
jgi:hypothetical protein